MDVRVETSVEVSRVRANLRRASLAASLGVVVALGGAAASVSLIDVVVQTDDSYIRGGAAALLDLEQLEADSERESRTVRGVLLGFDGVARDSLAQARAEFDDDLDRLHHADQFASRAAALLDIAHAEAKFRDATNTALETPSDDPRARLAAFEAGAVPMRHALDLAMRSALVAQRALVADQASRAHEVSFAAIALVAAGALGGILAMLYLALVVRRTARTAASVVTQLDATNADLDHFAGRVAHDLRNVLAPLKPGVAVLARADVAPVAGADARLAATRDRVFRAVDRADELLDGLLAFARAGMENTRVGDSGSADLAEVARDAADALAQLRADVDAKIEIDAPNIKVACPRPLLFDIILNLINNSLKHLREQPERTVRVTAMTDANYSVALQVADTGPGVPPDALASLGQPFFRVPGDPTAGTGIGLATVRRIVEACHGTLKFKSEHGFVAEISLPAASAAR